MENKFKIKVGNVVVDVDEYEEVNKLFEGFWDKNPHYGWLKTLLVWLDIWWVKNIKRRFLQHQHEWIPTEFLKSKSKGWFGRNSYIADYEKMKCRICGIDRFSGDGARYFKKFFKK